MQSRPIPFVLAVVALLTLLVGVGSALLLPRAQESKGQALSFFTPVPSTHLPQNTQPATGTARPAQPSATQVPTSAPTHVAEVSPTPVAVVITEVLAPTQT